MHAKKYNEIIELSMQEILDCSKRNMHCKGGQPSSVADYAMKYGIAFEQNYPYRARRSSCRARYYLNKSKKKTGERLLEMLLTEQENEDILNQDRILQSSRQQYPKYTAKFDDQTQQFYYQVDYLDGRRKYVDVNNRPYTPSFQEPRSNSYITEPHLERKTISRNSRYEKVEGYYFLKESVKDVINALQYGPVVTAHYVPKSFKFYSKGVFDTQDCIGKTKYNVNHSTVIVGYNMDAPIPYFLMKNSWGADWGDNGYFKMKMGSVSQKNKGLCLVAGTPFMIMPYLYQ